MSNELQITNREFKSKKLQQLTNSIYKQGLSIKKSYARIAIALSKIDESKCYEMDGFSSVHDYAKQVLGINKSTSYAFLKIGREYVDSKSLESVLKHDEGNDYSISQLQVILPLKSVDTAKELAESNYINPDMSVKEIKEAVDNYINPKEGDEEGEGDEQIEVEAVEESSIEVLDTIAICKDSDGHIVYMINDEIATLKEVEQIISEHI